MKAKPLMMIDGRLQQCEPEKATHVAIRIPGPTQQLVLPVILKGTRDGTGCWTWNADTEKPTLRPSVLVSTGHFAEHFDPKKDTCWCEYYKNNPNEEQFFHCNKCHTHVNDGVANFLPDSTHEFSGKSADLLEVE